MKHHDPKRIISLTLGLVIGAGAYITTPQLAYALGLIITDKAPSRGVIITDEAPSRALIITDEAPSKGLALTSDSAITTVTADSDGPAASGNEVIVISRSGYAQPSGSKQGAEAPQRRALSRRMAGSYLLDLELVGRDGQPFSVQALATLAADGGVVATDTDDFGLGTGAFFHSTKHGAWEPTGKHELTMTVIEFAYDASGNLTTLFRLIFDVSYDDQSYRSGEGEVTFDAFLPGQDPLDAAEPPVASGLGSMSFRKITAH